MTDFKTGDQVRVVRFTESASRSRTAQAGETGRVEDTTRSTFGRIMISTGSGSSWVRPEDLELVTATTPATGEKMVPASRVREIAQRYARQHGWCSVVDRALKEIGAEDDSMVEVEVTSVRKIRLRRTDLDKLHTDATLSMATNQVKLNAAFVGSTPDDASLQSFTVSLSEPVEVQAETWLDCSERPPVGARVRVRPGPPARSYVGDTVRGGTEGTRVVSFFDDERSGILIEFSGDFQRRLFLEDLQYLQS